MKTKRKQTVRKQCVLAGMLILMECFLAIHVHDQMYTCEEDSSNGAVVIRNQASMIPSAASTIPNAQSVVVLDAGQVGYDGGSVRSGLMEKDLTLMITKQIGEELSQHGIDVIYTRENDDWYFTDDNEEDLAYRLQIAKEANADIFFSIHLNCSEQEVSGEETWVSYFDEDALRLRKGLLKAMIDLQYTNDRGVKNQDEAALYVLQHNQSCASSLEVVFLSSSHDMTFLQETQDQQVLAEAISTAIVQYLEKDRMLL